MPKTKEHMPRTKEPVVEVSNGTDSAFSIPNAGEVERLLASKRWAGKKGRSSMQYPMLHDLFYPFIQRLEKQDGIELVKVETSHEVTNKNEDDTANTAYGRSKIEARFTQADRFDHKYVVGMVSVLDTTTPEVIVYSGRQAQVCLNLHLLNAGQMQRINLFSSDSTEDVMDAYFEARGKDQAAFEAHVERLQATYWNADTLYRKVGKLYFQLASLELKFGAASLRNAIELLTNPTSIYALDADGGTTAWNFLQSLTQFVTDRAYANVAPIKTVQMVEAVGTMVD